MYLWIQMHNKSQKKDTEKTNVLLREMNLIQIRLVNIEKQFNNKLEGLYGSHENILKGNLTYVKKIQENILIHLFEILSKLANDKNSH